MIRFIAFIILLSFSFQANAQHSCKDHKQSFNFQKNRDASESIDLDPRADSLDILHYTISLDFPEGSNTIEGSCEILFKVKTDSITFVTLDLENLTVNSVQTNENNLIFTHNEGKINIQLDSTAYFDDEFTLIINYGGQPAQDPAGFGGFYFTAGYAFNLGVSLTTSPHGFGRAWFPCFDNFITRSTYKFNITTHGNNTSYCGGLMTNEVVAGNSRTRTWEINQTIPTYLVSVAVAPYTSVNRTYSSINGSQIPANYVALPADTTGMINSFINLEPFFHEMEDKFGPFQWDRIGFVLVPFNAGAMEHAMNVAYPRLIAQGQLTFQNIMAHELAHSWFGNLVTCKVAEEMWLNEGFANYCEFLFAEWIQGEQNYITSVRNNHRNLLHFAHVRDGGYHALSNVPQSNTYGDHSYKKGADIIHTLRSYMGDSAFYDGLKYYLDKNAFDHATSQTLQQSLEESSGQNLSDFFDGWIHQAGWPHFTIDSLQVQPEGENFFVKVHYRQRLVEATEFLNNVPMQITFMANDWQQSSVNAILSGETGFVEFTIPINPEIAFLNNNEKISHAVTAENRVLKQTGGLNLTHTLFELNTMSISDSTFLRIEHNWAAPGGDVEGYFTLSPNRYWTVKGISNGAFNARGRVYYDGRTNNTAAGWLDHNHITFDDAVVILYRENPGKAWRLYDNYENNPLTNAFDKRGYIDINNLKFGEYCFALNDSAVSVNELKNNKNNEIEIFPNPSTDKVFVNFKGKDITTGNLELVNLSGQKVYSQMVNQNQVEIEVKQLQKGIYFVVFRNSKNEKVSYSKLVVQ